MLRPLLAVRPAVLNPARWSGEELANCVTHGVGLVLSVGGVSVLLPLAAQRGDAWAIVGCSIYGITLVAMYIVSTLYHGLQHSPLKKTFRTIDHVCIYFFIAGSYTPFALVYLRESFGWHILVTIWACAAIGTWCKVAVERGSELVSIVTYLLMGWLCLVVIEPLAAALPSRALTWLFLGGGFYTLGVVFYVRDNRSYNHAIWHLFVLAGSCSHYCAILYPLV